MAAVYGFIRLKYAAQKCAGRKAGADVRHIALRRGNAA
jgi:hypothetical protein